MAAGESSAISALSPLFDSLRVGGTPVAPFLQRSVYANAVLTQQGGRNVAWKFLYQRYASLAAMSPATPDVDAEKSAILVRSPSLSCGVCSV